MAAINPERANLGADALLATGAAADIFRLALHHATHHIKPNNATITFQFRISPKVVKKVLRISQNHFNDSKQEKGKVVLSAYREVLTSLISYDIYLTRSKSFSKQTLAWSRLAHANVASLYSPSPSTLSFYQDYYEKGDLYNYVKHGGSHLICYSIIEGILKGLAYLHSHNPAIVHGGLNTRKIYVTSDDKIKIGEFGLAESMANFSQRVPTVSFDGLARWTSPERIQLQAEGYEKTASIQSDMWSFGCVLFEVLTGRLPYAKYKYDPKVIQRIVAREPPGDLAQVTLSSCTVTLQEVIRKCWAEASQRASSVELLGLLSIKAVGLYGLRTEIVKHLKQAQFLDDSAAALLYNQCSSANQHISRLPSGLYLILQPDHIKPESSWCRLAYIVYWPEESTWDDQAASSSVRLNRATFMRYLSKLTDQVVALVSPEQANKFVWDTGARNGDSPADRVNEDDDDSRQLSFEVSKWLEQEEDAISHPGFSIPVEPKHLPKNTGMEDVRFVPGEQKAGVLVSINEPARMEHKPFRNETINQMSLEKTIKSSQSGPQIQLGDLSSEEVMNLGKHGLKDEFPGPFQKYDRAMREDKVEISRMEISDKKKINEHIERDTPMVRQEVQNVVRTLYDQLYP
ncbi:cytochrome P450 family protein [Ceratobasidium sp. AG-Ba]|nr:cytochrome P450 family protein [Ceratobasidium sp. AG-Ba]